MAETTNIDAKSVAKLRAETGAGMMDCKKALEESAGDFERAKDWLRKKGKQLAEKRAERETKAGTIAQYIHGGGRIGVLLELKCETDFVGRNEEFQALARDLCMQVAAARPIAVSREQVPEALIAREKAIYAEQAKGKPPAVVEKMVAGKLEAFFKEKVLLDQPFVKDPAQTVRDRIQQTAGKLGENVRVGRFARFELGEATE